MNLLSQLNFKTDLQKTISKVDQGGLEGSYDAGVI
jgi:hypothetical protein